MLIFFESVEVQNFVINLENLGSFPNQIKSWWFSTKPVKLEPYQALLELKVSEEYNLYYVLDFFSWSQKQRQIFRSQRIHVKLNRATKTMTVDRHHIHNWQINEQFCLQELKMHHVCGIKSCKKWGCESSSWLFGFECCSLHTTAANSSKLRRKHRNFIGMLKRPNLTIEEYHNELIKVRVKEIV